MRSSAGSGTCGPLAQEGREPALADWIGRNRGRSYSPTNDRVGDLWRVLTGDDLMTVSTPRPGGSCKPSGSRNGIACDAFARPLPVAALAQDGRSSPPGSASPTHPGARRIAAGRQALHVDARHKAVPPSLDRAPAGAARRRGRRTGRGRQGGAGRSRRSRPRAGRGGR